MNRDDGPRPGTQRSVAELLAAYSAESQPPSRRRVAEPADRGAPGQAPEGPGGDVRHHTGGWDPGGWGTGGRDASGSDASGYDTVGYDDRPVPAADHGPALGSRGGAGLGPYAPSHKVWAPAGPAESPGPPSGSPVTGTQAFGASSPASNQPTFGMPGAPTGFPAAPTGGPVTAVSPFAPSPGAPPQRGAAPATDGGGPPTAASPVAGPHLGEDDLDDSRDEAPAGLARGPQRTRPDDENDPENDLDAEPEERSSSVKDWAVMIVQLVLGALLGAVLWTVFSYLWQEQPVVALVLAAAATTGLVFGVRALRRSDDLQTTVLAVVVGLVVTVSPAAIVLLSR